MSCRRCHGRDSDTTDLCALCLSVSIPLCARDGRVRAYALVDEEDFERFSGPRWCLHSGGYAMRNTPAGALYLHREVMGLNRGDGHVVDHINRNKLDNRRTNLRLVTHRGNAHNRLAGRNSKSGVLGVFRIHDSKVRPWCAQITTGKETRHLGLFATLEEAAAARRAAEIQRSGEAA